MIRFTGKQIGDISRKNQLLVIIRISETDPPMSVPELRIKLLFN